LLGCPTHTLYFSHDKRRTAKEPIETHRPYYLQTDGLAALARQAIALHTRDILAVSEDLSGLQIPAELVWGADDQFQKLEYAERLADDLKAPLDRIEGGKHLVPKDQPRRSSTTIERVVRRVS
jgi:pimeloyl-ACP methyl ester carboxylesterase